MATDGAVWSYWMPWYNTWSSGFREPDPDPVVGIWRIDASLSWRRRGWANFDVGIPAAKARAGSLVGASMQADALSEYSGAERRISRCIVIRDARREVFAGGGHEGL